MTGAMVAQGRSMNDVLALIEDDLARVRAEFDPQYQYRTLFAAIEAGISELPMADQSRYESLAVFAGRGPFPREAVSALWQPELSSAEVGDLLVRLTGRSLLTATGAGSYIAHDLQYEVLKRRLGSTQLAATHARLLDGYRTRYPKGWQESVTDPYLARLLAGHLHDANLNGELNTLLANIDWIQSRLSHGQLPDLLSDYSYAHDVLSNEILKALRTSASVQTADSKQIRGQLTGRLIGHPDPTVASWAELVARNPSSKAWLSPITPALTPTTQMALTGHTGKVHSVALSADGATAVSGGADGTVQVWDLATSSQPITLTGHTGHVYSVALTADGATAVSGGADGTVRVWDLTTSSQRATLTGHTSLVQAVAVTPDGASALSSDEDGTVRVWDLTTSSQRATLTGHTGRVRSISLTADGTVALTCGDRTVRVWDLAAARPLAILNGHTHLTLAVAVTPDGTTAISSDFEEGTLRVWDLEPASSGNPHRSPAWQDPGSGGRRGRCHRCQRRRGRHYTGVGPCHVP